MTLNTGTAPGNTSAHSESSRCSCFTTMKFGMSPPENSIVATKNQT